ncbi:MAG: DUF4345 domain-containing protein [Gammaproteobacteria bacterium]
MSLIHKLVLYASLLVLGLSLVVPGLIEMVKPQPGNTELLPGSVDAKNHFRALNGMMIGIGIIAFWACFDLGQARTLIFTLGCILLLVVIARLYSLIVDGSPSSATWLYLFFELFFAVVFLAWPPK